MSEQQPETPKEKQSENYDLFKLILEDIRIFKEALKAIEERLTKIENDW